MRAAVAALALTCVLVPAAGQADADTTPPEIAALAVTPAVETGVAGADVTLVATLTDDVSGVAARTASGTSTCVDGGSSSVALSSPSGAGFTADFERRVGDEYAAVVHLPRYAEAGTWTIAFVALFDCARNVRFLPTEQLAARGFPTSFQVSGESDSTPPVLSALAIAPPSVETSAGDAEVTVTATITDDLSGVSAGPYPACDPTITYIVFGSPTGSSAFGTFMRRSGDEFEAVVELPRYAAAGTWRVETLSVVDCVRNQRQLSAAQLTALGFPSSFEVTGVSDSTPPVLSALAFSPAVVSPDGDLTVSATVTDDLSGVAAADAFTVCDGFGASPTQIMFRSPSGTTRTGVFERRGGDAYETTVDLPSPAEEGTWTVTTVLLADCARNQRVLRPDELAGMGFPTSFRVLPPAYEFGGFFAPLDGDALARRNPGSGMAVKFRLGGAEGTDVFDPGFPQVQPIDCATREPLGDGVALGSSDWVFHGLADGVYQYKWKSSHDWRNVCRRLILGFDDGSRHTADVHFK